MRCMNSFLRVEEEVCRAMNYSLPSDLELSITVFSILLRYLKREIDDQEFLDDVSELCASTECSDKTKVFLDMSVQLLFFAGKGRLFDMQQKQTAYRRLCVKILHECYLYLRDWFEAETNEQLKEIPYTEHLWDDFQLCTVANDRSRIQFWKLMLNSYRLLRKHHCLPEKAFITKLLLRHSRESYVFRNHCFAYFFQAICSVTALLGVYLICSMAKVLYSLLVELPYHRLLLYSGSKQYDDSIDDYLTLWHQLNSFALANRECLIGICIGLFLLILMDIPYSRYVKRIKSI